MPLSLGVTAILVGWWLLRNPRHARLGRALVISGVVGLMLFSNKLVSKHLIRPLEALYPGWPEFAASTSVPAELAACKHVVVLGGGNGQSPGLAAMNLLSTSALARVTEAVRILRVLPEAKLIVSGPRSGNRESHATVLARAAESLGVSPERIIHVDRARDTEEEAEAVRALVGRGRVALVTSAWHMPRSMALFRDTGLSPVACPTDYQTHAGDGFRLEDLSWDSSALNRSTLAIRERIGFLWIWLRRKT